MRTVGKLTTIKGYDYRIENKNGNKCPVGETGEIVALSPMRIINYLKDKDQPPIDWIKTGDLGRVDENGNLEIVGRTKETIILEYAGLICPSLVENMMSKSEMVEEVA